MSRTLLDVIGEDIIGAIFKIGTIRAHQLKNGEWHAYIVAEGDPQESIYSKSDKEVYVKRFMSGHHINVVKDESGDTITGATRKELIKKIKRDPRCGGLTLTFSGRGHNFCISLFVRRGE